MKLLVSRQCNILVRFYNYIAPIVGKSILVPCLKDDEYYSLQRWIVETAVPFAGKNYDANIYSKSLTEEEFTAYKDNLEESFILDNSKNEFYLEKLYTSDNSANKIDLLVDGCCDILLKIYESMVNGGGSDLKLNSEYNRINTVSLFLCESASLFEKNVPSGNGIYLKQIPFLRYGTKIGTTGVFQTTNVTDKVKVLRSLLDLSILSNGSMRGILNLIPITICNNSDVSFLNFERILTAYETPLVKRFDDGFTKLNSGLNSEEFNSILTNSEMSKNICQIISDITNVQTDINSSTDNYTHIFNELLEGNNNILDNTETSSSNIRESMDKLSQLVSKDFTTINNNSINTIKVYNEQQSRYDTRIQELLGVVTNSVNQFSLMASEAQKKVTEQVGMDTVVSSATYTLSESVGRMKEIENVYANLQNLFTQLGTAVIGINSYADSFNKLQQNFSSDVEALKDKLGSLKDNENFRDLAIGGNSLWNVIQGVFQLISKHKDSANTF